MWLPFNGPLAFLARYENRVHHHISQCLKVIELGGTSDTSAVVYISIAWSLTGM